MKLLVVSVICFLAVNAKSNQQQWKQYKAKQTIGSADVPESFDWRNSVAALLPRTMKNVDQSWAFAVAATLEVGLFRYNGTVEYISVQHMLDCVDFKSVLGAYYYYFLNGARVDEFYPYTGEQQDCQWAPEKFFISYEYVTGNETDMKALVAQDGALTVSIDGVNLDSYTSGIIDGSQCEQKEDNYKRPWSAAIVGYGTENGTDYWILKNSLGPNWGEEGYFRLKRNVNACGITSEVWSTSVVAHA